MPRSQNHWVILVALGALVAAACGAAGPGATSPPATDADPGATSPPAATPDTGEEERRYQFVVSNNFLGNDYRPQLLRLAELTAQQPPFKDRIELRVVQSDFTTEAQLADLNNIIRSQPDAILIEVAHPTALNRAIKQACDQGIVVVWIDQGSTEECAYGVTQDFYGAQYILGEWVAHVLGGEGTVFVDLGLPGPDISKEIRDGFVDGLQARGPNIQIAGEYSGEYSQGPSQQAISSLLVGRPDVDAIHNQGYCTPVFNALDLAGQDPVPATCFAYNQEMVACGQPGHLCGIETGSPVAIQIGMQLALDILDGNPPAERLVQNHHMIYLSHIGDFEPSDDRGIIIEEIKIGENAFPDLFPGLALPFALPEYDISGDDAAGGWLTE